MKSKIAVLALLTSMVISLSASAQEFDTFGGFTDIKREKNGILPHAKNRWSLVVGDP